MKNQTCLHLHLLPPAHPGCGMCDLCWADMCLRAADPHHYEEVASKLVGLMPAALAEADTGMERWGHRGNSWTRVYSSAALRRLALEA
jgi:hypothetical protein